MYESLDEATMNGQTCSTVVQMVPQRPEYSHTLQANSKALTVQSNDTMSVSVGATVDHNKPDANDSEEHSNLPHSRNKGYTGLELTENEDATGNKDYTELVLCNYSKLAIC